MKYQRFIIILFTLSLLMTACRRAQTGANENNQLNYAAGSLSYPVLLNGVGIQVDQAGLLSVQDDSNPDYAHVVLALSVSNQSDYDVVPPTMTLVDAHGNLYPAWQSALPYEDQINRLPLSVPNGQSGIGNLVFIVPNSALQDNLRLRWDSAAHQSRIDVFLGTIGVRAN
ncbi:MAG: hypothetical protein KC441_02205 [Anaerolineales bacterium]|nr:hypothetical protein [Anaerolineales bacterium]